jgi:hypothetical protein
VTHHAQLAQVALQQTASHALALICSIQVTTTAGYALLQIAYFQMAKSVLSVTLHAQPAQVEPQQTVFLALFLRVSLHLILIVAHAHHQMAFSLTAAFAINE